VGVLLPRHATIKLEAYPFTRPGALSGVVEHVSADAIADEARGPVFPARIVVNGGALRGLSDGQIPFSPGMAAQVDVRTGQRTVTGYLLSPIAWATQEAGRER
jgi:hemolysin D